MPLLNANAEAVRTKRQLRMRIARTRRRINLRLDGSRREARRLLMWRTYVERYPLGSLAAALGTGMAVSAGMKGPRMLRSICALLLSAGASAVADGFKAELRRVWKESTPRRTSEQSAPENNESRGADDGEA